MIELNLLPDVKQEFIRTQRQKRLVISLMILVSIISAAVVLLLAFFVYAAQPAVQLLIDNDIKDKAATLTKNKNLPRDLTIQNQLTAITKLHESKGVYDRLFDYLKNLNPSAPNNISISSATLDATTGTVTLEATAKDYQAIAVFQDTLKNAKLNYRESGNDETQKTPLFSGILISEAALGQNSTGLRIASFKATLTYEPNAFAWAVNSPNVSIPNESTTPSAARVSVFSETPAPPKKEGTQ